MMLKFPSPVAVAGAARTPQGRWDGVLRQHTAPQLAGAAIAAAVERAGTAPDQVRLAVVGSCVQAGLGLGPARQAATLGGLPPNAAARAVNSVCGSGAAAVADAALHVSLGAVDWAVAAGMESASNAPYLLGPLDREGNRVEGQLVAFRMHRLAADLVDQVQRRRVLLKDANRYDGLFWPIEGKFMAEYAAALFQREQMDLAAVDAAAARSHARARAAWAEGAYAAEVIPMGGVVADQLLSEDECDAIRARDGGQPVNACNAAAPADGAAALVLGRPELVERPLGYLLGYAVVNTSPEGFLRAPGLAYAELAAGLEGFRPTICEVNEAFALQIPLFEHDFAGMELNVHGGAVALGHPLGATGARLVITLLHAMARHGHSQGVAAICFGGGGAYAIAVERPCGVRL